MKKYFESGTPLIYLVLAVVITLCSLSTDAGALTLKLANDSVFENMLNADPGEDPHLKTDPEIQVFYLWDCETQSAPLLVSDVDHQGRLRGQDREETTSLKWHSRVNHKFTSLLQKYMKVLRK